jgi:hypothetical protein
MATHETVGRVLKLERERRGIPLEAIAASTKIRLSLLAALEAGDVSGWPDGVLRRAFIRQYLTAIGLTSEPGLTELEGRFSETGPSVDATRRAHTLPREPDPAGFDGELRMVFATGSPASRTRVRRALAALGELGAILLCSTVLARMLHAPIWTVISVVALTYYPLVTALTRPSTRFRWRSRERLRRLLPRFSTHAEPSANRAAAAMGASSAQRPEAAN